MIRVGDGNTVDVGIRVCSIFTFDLGGGGGWASNLLGNRVVSLSMQMLTGILHKQTN